MVPNKLSRSEALSLAALTAACGAVLANTVLQDDGAPLSASLALSGVGFAATYALVRWLGPTFVRAGLSASTCARPTGRPSPSAWAP